MWQCKVQYPEAANVLQRSIYMDDINDSFSNYSKALDIVQGVDDILRMGNFEVKEWIIADGE